jgi:hypothetical protein
LVRSTELTAKGLEEHEEWCKQGYPERHGEPFDSTPTVCHSFVKNGYIQYLSDCTHEFAGLTIELQKVDD